MIIPTYRTAVRLQFASIVSKSTTGHPFSRRRQVIELDRRKAGIEGHTCKEKKSKTAVKILYDQMPLLSRA